MRSSMEWAALPIEMTKYATVRIQIVQVFANSQNAAFAMHMPRKSPADARFAHRMIENMAGDFFHGVGILNRFFDPRFNRLSHLAQSALKKMIGAFDDDQLLRFVQRTDQLLKPGARSELVAAATHKELRLIA